MLRYYVKHRLQHWASYVGGWQRFGAPYAAARTDRTTCVLVNGVPKSGTGLLRQLIEHAGRWVDVGVCINASNTVEHGVVHLGRAHWSLGRAHWSLGRVLDGQYAVGHVPYSWAAARRLESPAAERHYRHVLIYRDPRDALISWMRWQPDLMENYEDPVQRLTEAIRRRRTYPTARYAQWLTRPGVLGLRFASLYGELCARTIGPALQSVYRFLELDVPDGGPLAEAVLGAGPTATPIAAKVGQWRRAMTPYHIALLRGSPEFAAGMRAFGYTWEDS